MSLLTIPDMFAVNFRWIAIISEDALKNRMVSLENEQAEKIAAEWSLRAPPIRPGWETLDILAREMDGTERSRILILGATPELVDFSLRKRASRITLMDQSEDWVKAMESLGSEDWTGVEKIIADWRTPREDLRNAFNTILGDGSFNMVSYPEEWETVLRNLAAYLVPGGRVIARNLTCPSTPFSFTAYLEEALRHFRTVNQNRDSLKILLSTVRQAAFVGSVDSTSLVLEDLRRKLEREACQKLKSMADFQEDHEIIEILLGTEKEQKARKGGYVPRKENISEIFHAAGFTVRSFQPVENRFGLDVSFVLTAVKT